MARIAKITNEQILEAARSVFLEQGFTASTLEIAQRAGISEASIFKRFSTKEELFFTALGIPDTPLWVQKMAALVGQGDIKGNLVYICQQILDFYREVIPRLMMLRSRGTAIPEICDQLDSKQIRDVNRLTTFLEQEIQQGRLKGDGKTIAVVLLGSLMKYVLLEQTHPSDSESDTLFVQQLIELIWQGIAVES
ncbi:MAG TPA: helix-turn-helix domain-containing protein [Nostocaceae cyanobacterium]|nr:helix-turn-helix domain-containing protein [Nostocaceae cyanobacterium]